MQLIVPLTHDDFAEPTSKPNFVGHEEASVHLGIKVYKENSLPERLPSYSRVG